MVDVSTVSELLVAFSVVFGVISWYMQSKEMKEIHETRLFMQIYDHRTDVESWRQYCEIVNQMGWKDYDDFLQKYGSTNNPEAFEVWQSMGCYFSGIGVLVRRKLIDIGFVYDLMPNMPIRWWSKVEPIIRAIRERWDLPEHMKEAEYLCNELMKIKEQQRASANM